RLDATLNASFNGGTDMLIRTLGMIRRFPDAPVMRTGAGVRWDRHVKIGKAGGKVVQLQAVDVNGDGKLDVFAACPAGDKVFLNQGQMKLLEMEGLKSASRAAAWADFAGDGRLDLASLSEDGLKIHRQTAPGKFTAFNVPLPRKVEGECLSLHV